MACNDVLFALLSVIIFVGILIYLCQCDKPILNEGTIDLEYDPVEQTPYAEFEHKKKKYVKRSRDDIDKQFDINELLPQDFEDDFFDIEPLQARRMDDSNLIHPMKHMGTDSRGASMKNASRDLRGGIPIPKQEVGPFLQSNIDPDTNIRPLCR